MALKKVGAIWEKRSKKGKKYLSLKVSLDGDISNIVYLTAFKNTYKKRNQPDWNIYIDVEEEEVNDDEV